MGAESKEVQSKADPVVQPKAQTTVESGSKVKHARYCKTCRAVGGFHAYDCPDGRPQANPEVPVKADPPVKPKADAVVQPMVQPKADPQPVHLKADPVVQPKADPVVQPEVASDGCHSESWHGWYCWTCDVTVSTDKLEECKRIVQPESIPEVKAEAIPVHWDEPDDDVDETRSTASTTADSDGDDASKELLQAVISYNATAEVAWQVPMPAPKKHRPVSDTRRHRQKVRFLAPQGCPCGC